MLKKWLQTIRVSLVRHMAYKTNFLLMVIGPALVFFFVKYSLWSAIYSTGENLVIQGYDFQEMIQYQIWVFIVGLFAMGHTSMNLAIDIRLGHISKYLIYPFHFWQYNTASFLAFQVIQMGIALFTLCSITLLGLLQWTSLQSFLSGLSIVLLVSFLWFLAQYILGLVAFWLEETWVLRVIFSITVNFLSGAIMPIEVFPKMFQQFVFWTPFPYMSYVPVKIIMGTYEGSIAFVASILLFWIGLFFLAANYVWKEGLKMYTAAGM